MSGDAEVEMRLDDFCRAGILAIQNGFACGKWNDEGKGILQLRPFNITNSGQVSLDATKYVETERNVDAYLLEDGDVIFNNTNSEALVGKAALWARTEQAVLSNHMTILRVLRTHDLCPEFLALQLLKKWLDGYFHSVCRRHVNQASVSIDRLRDTAFPALDVSEQRKIAAVLGLVQRAIEQQERLIALTSELKKTLLHQLFTQGLHGEAQKETEIGPVPESWVVSRLGDVAAFKSGGTPSRSNASYWENGCIPWVKTGEVNYCEIKDTEEKITDLGLSNSSAKLFPPGTLLMAMYGQGVTRGKVAILGIEAATNQACAAIFPSEEVKTEFLYYFFEYHYERIRNLGHGANQKNLSAEILKTVTVSFPKQIKEQKNISSALKTLDRSLAVPVRKKCVLTDLFRTLLHQLMTAEIRVCYVDLEALGVEVGGEG